jgi:hypothetical protein
MYQVGRNMSLRKTLSVLGIVFALLLPSLIIGSVQAIRYCQVVHVMVAADEEFIWRMKWEYGYTDWKFLADTWIYFIQDDFLDNFQIYLNVLLHTTWDSDDDLADSRARRLEACRDTGFHSGMDVQGAKIDILVAYTGQLIEKDRYGNVVLGCAQSDEDKEDYGTTLVSIQADRTDNLVQHEISHLFGTRDHWFSIDCVMSYYGGLYTHNWCDVCKETILENRDRFGEWLFIPHAGGGGGCYPRDWEAVE